ncbi:hypothetical protein AVV36_gp073 [Pectobacterium bacteriophage PM2]|uniref:Uncharacterized protein n=1 Tax=Pectobacterium bacteriophage PM2 TaxID=1429794 RepID=A0A0A0Q2E1_9CAUD|nr:hypothetical protein AVV36_gp073 [Pectobacterium bacteriophage PM2]AHY25035.1 hypothetical protein PM2_073 [Pectobacterium bacteriophage PM2]
MQLKLTSKVRSLEFKVENGPRIFVKFDELTKTLSVECNLEHIIMSGNELMDTFAFWRNLKVLGIDITPREADHFLYICTR